MTTALDKLPPKEWKGFGILVDVPVSKLDEIQSHYSSDEERKTEVIRVYLTKHPHPTWEHVSNMLYYGGIEDEQYHIALNHLQSMFPTGQCSYTKCLNTQLHVLYSKIFNLKVY